IPQIGRDAIAHLFYLSGVVGSGPTWFLNMPANRWHLRTLAVDLADQLDARGKQAFGKRFCAGSLSHVRVLVEELEIAAPIENVEELLILARSKQIWTEARPAADHLPELCLGPHRLEEHEVDDLRHVYAGVQHVDRNRNVRWLVRVV